MAGRTTHDQLVVFPGAVELAGRLVEVKIREAHGMTIFGEVGGGAAGTNLPIFSERQNLQPI
jgi:hypothetical protein